MIFGRIAQVVEGADIIALQEVERNSVARTTPSGCAFFS